MAPLTPEQARTLMGKAISLTKADACEVNLNAQFRRQHPLRPQLGEHGRRERRPANGGPVELRQTRGRRHHQRVRRRDDRAGRPPLRRARPSGARGRRVHGTAGTTAVRHHAGVLRQRRQYHPGISTAGRGQQHHAREGEGLHGRGVSAGRCAMAGHDEHGRAIRLPPPDRRHIFRHRAVERRDRIRIRHPRGQRPDEVRPGFGLPDRGRKGSGEPERPGHRAREVHRDPRARSRDQSAREPPLQLRRAAGGRRPQLHVQGGRGDESRGEAGGRAGAHLLRSRSPGYPDLALARRRPALRAHRLDRRRGREEPVLLALLGPEERGQGDPLPAQPHHGWRDRDHRGADQRHEPRGPRDPDLVYPLGRSADGAGYRPDA